GPDAAPPSASGAAAADPLTVSRASAGGAGVSRTDSLQRSAEDLPTPARESGAGIPPALGGPPPLEDRTAGTLGEAPTTTRRAEPPVPTTVAQRADAPLPVASVPGGHGADARPSVPLPGGEDAAVAA